MKKNKDKSFMFVHLFILFCCILFIFFTIKINTFYYYTGGIIENTFLQISGAWSHMFLLMFGICICIIGVELEKILNYLKDE